MCANGFFSLRGKRKEKMTMSKTMNLQDIFLNHARKEKIPITLFLTNGFQFKGMVRGFDGYTVIVDSDGKQELIYKHAISTIIPSRPVSILDSEVNPDNFDR